MPRFFFDVIDRSGLFVDEDGMELVDMDAAIVEARRALSDMMRDTLRADGDETVVIAIRDGVDGPVILKVSLTTIMPDATSK